MGTSILRSNDCLQGRLRNDAMPLATSRLRSRTNSTNHNRRCRRTPLAPNHLDRDRSRSGERSAKVPATTNLVIGQVEILKRGEKLSLENKPVTVKKQIRVSDAKEIMYAGSAFVTSPHPIFVPVPDFLGRNDAATSDLRPLLRLDD